MQGQDSPSNNIQQQHVSAVSTDNSHATDETTPYIHVGDEFGQQS
jgi:hypothetical protein